MSLCLALVIAAPTGSLPGTGLLLETKTDLEAEGCVDERVKQHKGLWLTNTHVSLETAYAMCGHYSHGARRAFHSGLYWRPIMASLARRVGNEPAVQVRRRGEPTVSVAQSQSRAAQNSMLRCARAPKPRADAQPVQTLVEKRARACSIHGRGRLHLWDIKQCSPARGLSARVTVTCADRRQTRVRFRPRPPAEDPAAVPATFSRDSKTPWASSRALGHHRRRS